VSPPLQMLASSKHMLKQTSRSVSHDKLVLNPLQGSSYCSKMKITEIQETTNED
jgi:hypothetical protein